ncbi:hypothetical protein EKI60_06540 [Candidatus Saccharibacteria bacterium]|nr:MAG: hypothetical protein EKI60_06540 [Candidatus Saccharibacteria bacterium]
MQKPSTEINERMDRIVKAGMSPQAAFNSAVLEYLDEQHERSTAVKESACRLCGGVLLGDEICRCKPVKDASTVVNKCNHKPLPATTPYTICGKCNKEMRNPAYATEQLDSKCEHEWVWHNNGQVYLCSKCPATSMLGNHSNAQVTTDACPNKLDIKDSEVVELVKALELCISHMEMEYAGRAAVPVVMLEAKKVLENYRSKPASCERIELDRLQLYQDFQELTFKKYIELRENPLYCCTAQKREISEEDIRFIVKRYNAIICSAPVTTEWMSKTPEQRYSYITKQIKREIEQGE